jgi:hypothetical protein
MSAPPEGNNAVGRTWLEFGTTVAELTTSTHSDHRGVGPDEAALDFDIPQDLATRGSIRFDTDISDCADEYGICSIGLTLKRPTRARRRGIGNRRDSKPNGHPYCGHRKNTKHPGHLANVPDRFHCLRATGRPVQLPVFADVVQW